MENTDNKSNNQNNKIMCNNGRLVPIFNWKYYFYLKCKGYNNAKTSEKMGMSVMTLQRRAKEVRLMSDEEFKVFLRVTGVHFTQ